MKTSYKMIPMLGFFLMIIVILPLSVSGQTVADFQFGNHIDNHQSTRLIDRAGIPTLIGSLFIFFTGDVDPVLGLPIARHPGGTGEVCGVDVDCVDGWRLTATPGEAKFLYHTGVNGEDHPVWLINRVQIPQPGSFTHFHWITTESDDTRASDVTSGCNAQDAGGLVANEICPGWFLELFAVRRFAFQHGNEIVAVTPGIDNATHLNLVSNYEVVFDITPTRP